MSGVFGYALSTYGSRLTHGSNNASTIQAPGDDGRLSRQQRQSMMGLDISRWVLGFSMAYMSLKDEVLMAGIE